MRWSTSLLLLTLAPLGCSAKAPQPDATAQAPAPQVEAPPEDATGTALMVAGCPVQLTGSQFGDLTLRKACGRIRVTGQVDVDGGTLTIEAGVTLAFDEGASLQVGYSQPAKLIVSGNEAEPVVFEAGGAPRPGAWRGVSLYGGAAGSVLEGLEIAHAGTDEHGALYLSTGLSDVRIAQLRFRDVVGPAIRADVGANPTEIVDCDFTQVASPEVLNLDPRAVKSLKHGLRFAPGAHVRVQGGVIGGRAPWIDPGVPYLVTGDISVRGDVPGKPANLLLSAGIRLNFMPDAGLSIGEDGEGRLYARATAEAPVTFAAAQRDADGTPTPWAGLTIGDEGLVVLHHTRLSHAGEAPSGVALRIHGKATVVDSHFEATPTAVRLYEDAVLEAFERNTFSGVPTIAHLNAEQLGQLGLGHTFDPGSSVAVTPAEVVTTTRWRSTAPAVLVFGGGETTIGRGARVTIEGGSVVRMAPGALLSVGKDGPAELAVEGSADAPVVFEAAPPAPEAPSGERGWGGIRLEGGTRKSLLHHVTLRGVDADACVRVGPSGEVAVDHVRCEASRGPAVSAACGARLSRPNTEADPVTQVVTDPDCP